MQAIERNFFIGGNDYTPLYQNMQVKMLQYIRKNYQYYYYFLMTSVLTAIHVQFIFEQLTIMHVYSIQIINVTSTKTKHRNLARNKVSGQWYWNKLFRLFSPRFYKLRNIFFCLRHSDVRNCVRCNEKALNLFIKYE